MWWKHDKYGSPAQLCPVSFGLAVGIVSFFAILIWSLWVMRYGVPPMMAEMRMAVPTLGSAFVHALLGLVKGFLFGFFVILLYDWISCCCWRGSKDEVDRVNRSSRTFKK